MKLSVPIVWPQLESRKDWHHKFPRPAENEEDVFGNERFVKNKTIW